MLDMKAAQQTFFEECRELLQQMEDILLAFESGTSDEDMVNGLFRAAHTIKGSAGLFGLDEIVRFTHVVESVLDRLRRGEIVIDSELVSLLLTSGDQIASLVAAAATEAAPDEAARGRSDELLVRLQTYLPTPAGGSPVADVAPAHDPVSASGGGPLGTDTWHLSLRFSPEVLKIGMDPIAFIRYLGTLGDVVHLETLADALPAFPDYDPEACYLGFELDLRSAASRQEIEAVFEFVRDDAQIRILPPHARAEEYIALILELPEDNARLGEMLIAGGALTRRELDEMLAVQASEAQGGQRLGELLANTGMVSPPVVEAALEKQKQTQDKRQAEARSVKVPSDKLDLLIDLVGELVIAGAGTQLLARRSHRVDLTESATEVMRLVEDVRDAALRLRMVQIGEVFGRFPRVVRDLSRELGKDIELIVSGAETELDKSMVERLGDPLMHLVRNAMDHGLEPTELRLARGKPARGRLELGASHESGNIVIEVKDDGGGLDRERILAKALDRGLVQPDQSLSDDEVYRLIMLPGFSTAEKVSNLSGRGVGMDVVRSGIEALRGSIEIHSQPGEGTTIRLCLPLTLAIIDGFLIDVGKSSFVLPLDMVVECIELDATAEAQHSDYLSLRGEVLPLVRLRELFRVDEKRARRQNVVVVYYAGRRAGLVVDRLLGECQTVIKPLGILFTRLRGISGSTILASGEVALILDVPQLIQVATSHEGGRLGMLAR
ncbi:chemotaxis protein CheA [mine drainage metagenome]|uniref:Chemotaxis protein CheA n=1 Tax=mine drainage metagenome TaxID=410659 RepID=A0A1J5SGD8_9ZZZZ